MSETELGIGLHAALIQQSEWGAFTANALLATARFNYNILDVVYNRIANIADHRSAQTELSTACSFCRIMADTEVAY